MSLPVPPAATSPANNPAPPPVSPTSTANGSTNGGSKRHGTNRRVVITTPPWARHEQPVPNEDAYLSPTNGAPLRSSPHSSNNGALPSDIASMTSSGDQQVPNGNAPHSGNWWTFTLPLRKSSTTSPHHVDDDDDESMDLDPARDIERGRRFKGKSPMKERSRTSWFWGSYGPSAENPTKSPNQDDIAEEREDDQETSPGTSGGQQRRGRRAPRRESSHLLRLDLPLPKAPFTMAQAKTPGWDSPWAPNRRSLCEPGKAHTRQDSLSGPGRSELTRNASMGGLSEVSSRRTSMTGQSAMRRFRRQRKRFREYILYNVSVPLLFRIMNLAFTSAALGIAVRIRRLEHHNNVLGIIGSSPTIAIVFAPITISHVLIAIYLEYFGRPLGLWRTSAKLAHALVEVAFICCWSASLSISFDNYFTTSLQCVPPSVNTWWSQLPPSTNALVENPNASSIASSLCHEQLALICLVFVGLGSYCSNLVISLFRIIEKVKYHSGVSNHSGGQRIRY
ncbi:hypothetical protein FRC02_004625 [Tulasnella sp. 418]|nr:hypothetical protein FRC02_004625 [Tulasnella sp. 418]